MIYTSFWYIEIWSDIGWCRICLVYSIYSTIILNDTNHCSIWWYPNYRYDYYSIHGWPTTCILILDLSLGHNDTALLFDLEVELPPIELIWKTQILHFILSYTCAVYSQWGTGTHQEQFFWIISIQIQKYLVKIFFEKLKFTIQKWI